MQAMGAGGQSETVLLVNITGYTLCGITHCIGLLLLYRIRSPLENQRLIILNLAAAYVLISALQVKIHAQQLSGYPGNHIHNAVTLFFRIFMATIYILLMMYIVVDRVLDIFLHLKYPIYFAHHRVIIILAALWIFSLSLAVLLVILGEFVFTMKHILLVCFYLFFSTDILFLFVAVAAYVYLYRAVKRTIRRTYSRSSRASKDGKDGFTSPKFLVPCLLVATYALFNVTGSLLGITQYFVPSVSDKVGPVRHVFFICGTMSDAAIYVFLQRYIRRAISRAIGRKRNKCMAKSVWDSKERSNTFVSQTCNYQVTPQSPKYPTPPPSPYNSSIKARLSCNDNEDNVFEEKAAVHQNADLPRVITVCAFEDFVKPALKDTTLHCTSLAAGMEANETPV